MSVWSSELSQVDELSAASPTNRQCVDPFHLRTAVNDVRCCVKEMHLSWMCFIAVVHNVRPHPACDALLFGPGEKHPKYDTWNYMSHKFAVIYFFWTDLTSNF